jgi:hypothetical protein
MDEYEDFLRAFVVLMVAGTITYGLLFYGGSWLAAL